MTRPRKGADGILLSIAIARCRSPLWIRTAKASLDRTTEKTPFDRTIERDSAAAITPVEYCGLQKAVDHFKAELFEDALPDVLITYQRRAHSAGYFSPDRFSGRADKPGAHELALNPDVFTGQYRRGDLPDARTRDGSRVAARLRQALGGRLSQPRMGAEDEGGRPSAQLDRRDRRQGDRLVDDGLRHPRWPLRQSLRQARRHWLEDELGERPSQRFESGGGGPKNGGGGPEGGGSSKTKVTCPQCGQNAWGKPDLAISCTPCGTPMMPEAL